MDTYSRRRGRHTWLLGLGAAVLGFSPTPLAGQQQVESPEASMLLVTSTSEEATKHFWAGWNDFSNIFFARGAGHLEMALELDPNLGLARVLHGWGAPGLAGADRRQAIAEGIAAMGQATSAELVVATALKEWNANNAAAAAQLFGVATRMVPGDPHVAFLHAWTKGLGAGNTETGIIAMRKVTERFPDFAASYNILAYQLWGAGNEAGAMRAVRTYVKLMPDHPNSHDSYAELLQRSGRYGEAAKHYRKTLELDPDYAAGYAGLAEVYQLMGNSDQAVAWMTAAIDHAATPQGKIQTRRALANVYWMNGNRKAAAAQLQMVIEDATAAEYNNIVTAAHQELAVLEAMSKGKNVTAHLAAAAESGNPESQGQLAWTAVAYAIAGDVAMARTAAEALAEKAPDATISRIANAMVYLAEDRPAEAMKELGQANPKNVMVRALSARCSHMMGNKAEAMAFRMAVIDNRQLNFFNTQHIVAFRQVEKL